MNQACLFFELLKIILTVPLMTTHLFDRPWFVGSVKPVDKKICNFSNVKNPISWIRVVMLAVYTMPRRREMFW